ncbi:hypothetical protein [Actinomadura macrotermitis]|nr:hypothetical protein [Actinomadura macrotermitis]
MPTEGPPKRLLRWWHHVASLAVAVVILVWGPWEPWFRIVAAVTTVVLPLLWEQAALWDARRRRRSGDRR